jgi:hypothetical protein
VFSRQTSRPPFTFSQFVQGDDLTLNSKDLGWRLPNNEESESDDSDHETDGWIADCQFVCDRMGLTVGSRRIQDAFENLSDSSDEL